MLSDAIFKDSAEAHMSIAECEELLRKLELPL